MIRIGLLYDYTKVTYVDTYTPIIITCLIHGDFKQIPSNHLQGYGCPECKHDKHRLTLEQFIDAANNKHNNKYSYKKTKYINSDTKVTITCPIHGDFTQTPICHVNRGFGCPQCSMLRGLYSDATFENNPDLKEIDGYLYVIKYNGYVKIGITKQQISNRFPGITNDDILYLSKMNLYQAYLIEQHILNKFERNKLQLTEKTFRGWTECFERVDVNDILKEISTQLDN